MYGYSSHVDAPTVGPSFTLKPVIKELVRTQVCFPNLRLLVDKVSITVLSEVKSTLGNEAYRLFLTDGEKTIQGMYLV